MMKKDIEFNCNINGSNTDYSEYGIYGQDVIKSLQNSFNDIITDLVNLKNSDNIKIHVVIEAE